MRSLGEFFGHIAKGVKSDPVTPGAAPDSRREGRQIVRKSVQEEKQGNVILRRTTIEEVEVRDEKKQHS